MYVALTMERLLHSEEVEPNTQNLLQKQDALLF